MLPTGSANASFVCFETATVSLFVFLKQKVPLLAVSILPTISAAKSPLPNPPQGSVNLTGPRARTRICAETLAC
jgi:hypothetical protein